jgi:signal peptidase I
MKKRIRVSFLVALGLVATIRAASPLTMTAVVGQSMAPTLKPGAWYILDRGYYGAHAPDRGDIVVLRHDGETYVKRIHALPGDTVWLLRSDDGAPDILLEPWEVVQFRRAQEGSLMAGHWVEAVTLTTGHCYVVGDNTLNSIDSRTFGPVPIAGIVGRVTP